MDGKKRKFSADTYSLHPVSVCEEIEYDEVVIYTDSKKPLVVKKTIGEGCVYFVNAKEYAGAPAVDLAFRKVLEKLTPECLESETAYAKGNRNVQFSVFDRGDQTRDFYFIATDWHKECGDGEGELVLGENRYTIPVPFGKLVKVTACGNSALYPKNAENEVILFDGSVARVQGCGIAEFVLLKDGIKREFVADFSEVSVQEICL